VKLPSRTKLGPPRRSKIAPRPKTAAPFYLSPEWRALVEQMKIERFGSVDKARCEDPVCKGPGTGRIFGDHIIELRDGGRPLSPRNVLFRCGACHSRVTFERRAKRYGVRL
jgi:5-methylcytosine-specific restriction enzyme A